MTKTVDKVKATKLWFPSVGIFFAGVFQALWVLGTLYWAGVSKYSLHGLEDRMWTMGLFGVGLGILGAMLMCGCDDLDKNRRDPKRKKASSNHYY